MATGDTHFAIISDSGPSSFTLLAIAGIAPFFAVIALIVGWRQHYIRLSSVIISVLVSVLLISTAHIVTELDVSDATCGDSIQLSPPPDTLPLKKRLRMLYPDDNRLWTR